MIVFNTLLTCENTSIVIDRHAIRVDIPSDENALFQEQEVPTTNAIGPNSHASELLLGLKGNMKMTRIIPRIKHSHFFHRH